MTFSKGVYNTIKWIALIFLPAAGTLYAALAIVWNLKYTTQVTNSVLAVDTFLGALVGISSKGYKPPIDGHIYVTQHTADTATARIVFHTDPDAVIAAKKGYMNLAVLPDPGQRTQQVQVTGPAASPAESGDRYA